MYGLDAPALGRSVRRNPPRPESAPQGPGRLPQSLAFELWPTCESGSPGTFTKVQFDLNSVELKSIKAALIGMGDVADIRCYAIFPDKAGNGHQTRLNVVAMRMA